MSTSLKTQAFVLRKISLPNKDIVVTLFTKENGKMRCFAKGIKKITSRRLPHIQTGNLIQATIQYVHEKNYLHESSLTSAFANIKNDEKKYKFVYSFLFVIERLLPENQKEERVYNLVMHFFIHLSENPHFNHDDMTAYLNSLMNILGYEESPLPPESLLRLVEGLMNEKMPQISI